MITKLDKNKSRQKRHSRIRKALSGTPEMPRLSVKKTNKHMYAQLIDDVAGVTLVSASTNAKGVELANGGNIDAAKFVGAEIAKKAVGKGIVKVVFDRSGYIYHGRVKELADAARENGLKF